MGFQKHPNWRQRFLFFVGWGESFLESLHAESCAFRHEIMPPIFHHVMYERRNPSPQGRYRFRSWSEAYAPLIKRPWSGVSSCTYTYFAQMYIVLIFLVNDCSILPTLIWTSAAVTHRYSSVINDDLFNFYNISWCDRHRTKVSILIFTKMLTLFMYSCHDSVCFQNYIYNILRISAGFINVKLNYTPKFYIKFVIFASLNITIKIKLLLYH